MMELGQIVATPGALRAFREAGEIPLPYLARHPAGDWGEVCEADRDANDRAAENGERVLSSYTLHDGTEVWVITEWDRSATTVLLPEEY